MEIEIRQACFSDLPDIKDLFVNTVKTCCSMYYNEREIEVWSEAVNNEERWESAVEDQFFILACQNEEVLGFASLEKTKLKNKGYLDFMFVHAEHQRKGIAKRLLNVIKDEARSRGLTLIESDVSKSAFTFFKNNGFLSFKKKSNIIGEGINLVNYRMTKSL
ncbi:GNAT family N-acetyltransferase [Arcticibacterium luteifluviistationis]|uniref:N-acetyltransferase domain-containing protein n=1 Tax=Arcticibacterium luteifluviistationis TaxID=1784714 RepID=A0A2Z4G7X5_9BACT|nr:GNAT family N-acetyltransferase [Arcticibacterium luteifluviistationis]AWV97272.1 hypothetical protein DJ013_03440 [Arcticibacterium luteifluviistationis]